MLEADLLTYALQLLDLCMMDIDSLDYSYSVLAAAAFCHFSSFDVVHKVSGKPPRMQRLIVSLL